MTECSWTLVDAPGAALAARALRAVTLSGLVDFVEENKVRSKLLSIGVALTLVVLTSGVVAQSGDVRITNAWARATPGGAQTAATYVTLASVAGDRLTGASTPAAQQAELHTMTMDGSVMKMRQVDGIDVPAGQMVTLKPGGYHIMLTAHSAIKGRADVSTDPHLR